MKMNVSASNVLSAAAAVVLAAVFSAAATACSADTSRKVSSDGRPSDTAIVASGASSARPERPDVGASAGANPLRGATHYLGVRYDSLPAEIKYEGGSVLSRGANGVAGDYDFAHVRTPRGDMIWLDTVDARGGKAPVRVVRAELTIPPLANDERLFMASCDAGGKFDSRVVAIVVDEPNATRFAKIRQAWRANIAAGRFDVIPVTGVVCEDPGS